MNENNDIDKSLLQLKLPPAPEMLRAAVLNAIEAEREMQRKVPPVESHQRHWFASVERIASFAAPCLLLFSLAIFGLVDRSASNLLRPNPMQSVADSGEPRVRDTNRFMDDYGLTTPEVFFAQYFALLQTLNSELFHETHKKDPQVDGNWPPFGHLHHDSGSRLSDLA
jgi:hypothetical protein